MVKLKLIELLDTVRDCNVCAEQLPLGPRPVVQASEEARIMIVGQAPGTRVHESGIPWNDPSGERLRDWLGIEKAVFYNPSRVAIMPMGFCYPGKGKSGDLPPRAECAPLWHQQLLQHLPNIKLTLLIGNYAQNYYLDKRYKTLTKRVFAWQEYLPEFIPLVHPSPRNTHWLQQNPWFEEQLVPELREKVSRVLNK